MCTVLQMLVQQTCNAKSAWLHCIALIAHMWQRRLCSRRVSANRMHRAHLINTSLMLCSGSIQRSQPRCFSSLQHLQMVAHTASVVLIE